MVTTVPTSTRQSGRRRPLTQAHSTSSTGAVFSISSATATDMVSRAMK